MRKIVLLALGLLTACSHPREVLVASPEPEAEISAADERFPSLIRIPVLPEHEKEALSRLRTAGFEPELEQSEDGYPTFVLRGLSMEEAFRAASTVRGYIANRGLVGRWRRD